MKKKWKRNEYVFSVQTKIIYETMTNYDNVYLFAIFFKCFHTISNELPNKKKINLIWIKLKWLLTNTNKLISFNDRAYGIEMFLWSLKRIAREANQCIHIHTYTHIHINVWFTIGNKLLKKYLMNV